MSQPSYTIPELLQSDVADLETILLHPTFPQFCSSECKELTDFLFQDSTFSDLLDIMLLPNHASSTRLFRRSISFFTSNVYLKRFLESEPLLNRINTLTESNCDDPRICGGISQLFDFFIRTSNGEFLKKIPNLLDFLNRHIDNASMKDLLSVLISGIPPILDVTKEFILQMLSHEEAIKLHGAIMCIKAGLKFSQTLKKLLLDVDICSSFLEITIKAINATKLETFDLLLRLGESEEIDKARQKYIKVFPFHDCSDAVLAYATLFFKTITNPLVNRLFEAKPHNDLNRSIFTALDSMDDETLRGYVIKNDIPGKLMHSFVNCRTNPWIYKTADLLSRRTYLNPILDTPAWRVFISTVKKKYEETVKPNETHENKPPVEQAKPYVPIPPFEVMDAECNESSEITPEEAKAVVELFAKLSQVDISICV